MHRCTMAMTAGARIKYWREREGLTQEELAERCGMPQSKISRLETGVANVMVEDLEVIARALKKTMAELYQARAS